MVSKEEVPDINKVTVRLRQMKVPGLPKTMRKIIFMSTYSLILEQEYQSQAGRRIRSNKNKNEIQKRKENI
jgi:hypothetical protein